MSSEGKVKVGLTQRGAQGFADKGPGIKTGLNGQAVRMADKSFDNSKSQTVVTSHGDMKAKYKVGDEESLSIKDEEALRVRVLNESNSSKLTYISRNTLFWAGVALFVVVFCFSYGFKKVNSGSHFAFFVADPVGALDANGTYLHTISFNVVNVWSYFWVNYVGMIGIVWLVCRMLSWLMSSHKKFYDWYLHTILARGCDPIFWIEVSVVMGFLGQEVLFAINVKDAILNYVAFPLNMLPFIFLGIFQAWNMPIKKGQEEFIKMIRDDSNATGDEKDSEGMITVTSVHGNEFKRVPMNSIPVGEFIPGWHPGPEEVNWIPFYMAVVAWIYQIIFFSVEFYYVHHNSGIPWNVITSFSVMIIIQFFLVFLCFLHSMRIGYMSHYMNFVIVFDVLYYFGLTFIIFMLVGVSYRTQAES